MSNPGPEEDARLAEVWSGLERDPRQLNPKWFYDAHGSMLFDQITRQPEYYLTGCELEILANSANEIGRWIGRDAVLAELGAGNGEKAIMLLQALLRPTAYVPIDISPASIELAVRNIRAAMPSIRVEALCLDFSEDFAWPRDLSAFPRCLVFFGSTIGNMEPADAMRFLSRLHRSLRAGDKMLVGVDLKKDISVLNAAYNDRAGVTAAFNLNALAHLNHDLNANFDVGAFRHRAFYNPERGRMEMHLEAKSQQIVSLGGKTLSLAPGERIHTENSYKYGLDDFKRLTENAGFRSDAVWLDSKQWFSLHGLIA